MGITPFRYGETVTVVRPGGFDRNGDPLSSAEHTVEGVTVYPSSMDETLAGTAIDADWTLLGPFDTDIKSSDTIYRQADTARAEPLYAVGDSWPVQHPMNGWQPGCRVLLTYRRGGTV